MGAKLCEAHYGLVHGGAIQECPVVRAHLRAAPRDVGRITRHVAMSGVPASASMHPGNEAAATRASRGHGVMTLWLVTHSHAACSYYTHANP